MAIDQAHLKECCGILPKQLSGNLAQYEKLNEWHVLIRSASKVRATDIYVGMLTLPVGVTS